LVLVWLTRGGGCGVCAGCFPVEIGVGGVFGLLHLAGVFGVFWLGGFAGV